MQTKRDIIVWYQLIWSKTAHETYIKDKSGTKYNISIPTFDGIALFWSFIPNFEYAKFNKLFPSISAMNGDDKIIMVKISFSILVALSSIKYKPVEEMMLLYESTIDE